MEDFEGQYTQKGFKNIVGIDEVGRGPLAGPVCAAAVILPRNLNPELSAGINDSKKISVTKRLKINEKLLSSVHYGIASVNEEAVDTLNILEATRLAMKQAVQNLSKVAEPDFLLVDGNISLDLPVRQRSIIDGDAKCLSIAAASIIAKVYRDKLMEDYHRIYPKYNFIKNKGYGTKEHCEAIKQFGISKVHRRTFAKVKEYV